MPLKIYVCLFCLLSLVFYQELIAQTNIIEKLEKDCKCPEFDRSQSFAKLLDIGKSKNDIEIRLAKFNMGYNTYAIISYNKKKYNAVCYIAKQPNYRQYVTRKISSPYRRYVIDNQRLDTVLNRLMQYHVTNWKDPGFRGSRVADAGLMFIQYKVKQDTGSYRFTPPSAMLLDHPEVDAYQNLSKAVEVFQVMIKEAVIRDSRKKGFKMK
jgi:hypothetical protein